MIRVSVVASDTNLTDAIASTLSAEIAPDVIQLTYLQPWHFYNSIRNPRSVLVKIDDGEMEDEFMREADLSGSDEPLLTIKIALKSRNTFALKTYHLVDTGVEHIVNLVRDFSRTHFPAERWNEYSRGNQKRQALSKVGLG